MIGWDNLDFAILRELTLDAGNSAGGIGRKLKLSQPATWRRIKRLKDAGILVGRRIDLDAGSGVWCDSFSWDKIGD